MSRTFSLLLIVFDFSDVLSSAAAIFQIFHRGLFFLCVLNNAHVDVPAETGFPVNCPAAQTDGIPAGGHLTAVWPQLIDIFQVHADLIFRLGEETLEIDRTFSGSPRAIIHQRKCRVQGSRNGNLSLWAVLDRFSAEILIGDGEKTMTVAFYTDTHADGICFLADGQAVLDVEKYDIDA